MEKYNNFLEILERLKAAVSKMEQARTRQEIEALEKESKGYFQALTVKFPYIQADIHNFALKQTSRVAQADVDTILGK